VVPVCSRFSIRVGGAFSVIRISDCGMRDSGVAMNSSAADAPPSGAVYAQMKPSAVGGRDLARRIESTWAWSARGQPRNLSRCSKISGRGRKFSIRESLYLKRSLAGTETDDPCWSACAKTGCLRPASVRPSLKPARWSRFACQRRHLDLTARFGETILGDANYALAGRLTSR
jgi:hypothetical protein